MTQAHLDSPVENDCLVTLIGGGVAAIREQYFSVARKERLYGASPSYGGAQDSWLSNARSSSTVLGLTASFADV